MSDLFGSPEEMGVEFSSCATYRYALWRHWDWQGHANCVGFIGLNPSTADGVKNDTTISKEIGFAKRWGYGGIFKLNLYGFIATDPNEMYRSADPVGPDNDQAFGYYRSRVGLWVAAWGGSVPPRWRVRLQWQSRIAHVLGSLGQPVYCIGRTADGSPRHTSRLPYETPRELFWEPSTGKETK